MQPKRIYFIRRHPSIARDAFVARWREHGRLAMSFMAAQGWANVARYTHCDPVRALTDDPALRAHLPALDPSWDGMGIVLFHDAAARARHSGFAQARSALLADEDLAFAERVDRSGLVACEEVLKDGPRDGVKFACTLMRAGDSGWDIGGDIGGPYRERLRELERHGLRRAVLNRPATHPDGLAWGLRADLLEELWFADEAALRDAAASGWLADTAGLRAGTSLVVRETVLHPAPRGAPWPAAPAGQAR